MDDETYARAVDVENVKAKTLPRGRAAAREELRVPFKARAADPSPAGRRDAATLAVLDGGGPRRAGVARAAHLADFDAEGCMLTVRSGKGRRDRTVYLTPEVCRFLREWTRQRDAQNPVPSSAR